MIIHKKNAIPLSQKSQGRTGQIFIIIIIILILFPLFGPQNINPYKLNELEGSDIVQIESV